MTALHPALINILVEANERVAEAPLRPARFPGLRAALRGRFRAAYSMPDTTYNLMHAVQYFVLDCLDAFERWPMLDEARLECVISARMRIREDRVAFAGSHHSAKLTFVLNEFEVDWGDEPPSLTEGLPVCHLGEGCYVLKRLDSCTQWYLHGDDVTEEAVKARVRDEAVRLAKAFRRVTFHHELV